MAVIASVSLLTVLAGSSMARHEARAATRITPHLPSPGPAGGPGDLLKRTTNPTVPLGEWTVYDTTNSGVGGNNVNSMAVDAAGRPWVGLQPTRSGANYSGGGLSGFDGTGWTVVTTPELVNNWVSAVAVDNRNQVWAGSAPYASFPGGLAVRLPGGNWRHYLPGANISSIAVTDAEVWVGLVGGGVARFDPNANPPTLLGMLTAETTSNGLASNNVNVMAVRASSTPLCGSAPEYWVGHDNGVSVYTYGLVPPGFTNCGYSWANYSVGRGHPLPAPRINALAMDGPSRIWLGSDVSGAHGAVVLDLTTTATWTTYSVANSGLTHNTIRTLATDQQGRIWIGQTEPAPGKAEGTASLSPDAPDAPNKLALSIFDHGTWCYYEVGGGTCQNPSPAAGLPSNYVTAIAPALERVWIGTGDADPRGVASVVLNWKTFTSANSPLTTSIRSLWLDERPGQAWIGARDGVHRFDGAWRYYPLVPGGGTSAGITALHRDSAGRLWAGQTWLDAGDNVGSSIWLYQPGTDNWREFAIPDGTARLNSLASDRTPDDRVWVALGGGGVRVFNPTSLSWVSLSTANSPLVSNTVSAVGRDTTGQMWLATDQGISVYTGRSWTTYTSATTSGGLVSDRVDALAVDGSGRMWVGTEAGVSLFNGVTWTAYTVASTNGGLAGDSIQAIAVDPAGRVWFGTTQGVSRFDGSQWQVFTRVNSGLARDLIQPRALAVDNDDGAWFGTLGGLSIRGGLHGPIGLEAPRLSDFNPRSGPVDTIVTLSGRNFYVGSVDANRVFFTGPDGTAAEATLVDPPRADALRVRVPYNAVKSPIRIEHSGGTDTTTSDFTPVPTVSRYTPTAAGAGISLIAQGANLGGSTTKIRFANGVEAPSATPLASNEVRITIPPNAVSGPLTVITEGGAAALTPPFTLAQVCGMGPFGCVASGDGSAIEVNQGLPSEMYPLVAGKQTLVRVYTGTSLRDAPVTVDSGSLIVSGPGGGFLVPAVIRPRAFNNTLRAFSEQFNVHFFLSGAEIPTSGAYTFRVDLRVGGVSVYSATVTRTVERTKDMRILSVIAGSNPTRSELISLQRTMATLGRVYPLRRGVGPLDTDRSVGLRFATQAGFLTIPARFSGGSPPGPQVLDNPGFGFVTDRLEDSRVAANGAVTAGRDRFDVTVGFVPWRLNPGPGGILGRGWLGVFGITRGNINGLGINPFEGVDATGAVAVQELAHNIGRVGLLDAHVHHEFVLDSLGASPETRGFNVQTGVALPQSHAAMEGSCCGTQTNDNTLFEPDDFGGIVGAVRGFDSTGTSLAQRPAAKRTAGGVFAIQGQITAAGVVTRTNSYLLPPDTPLSPLAAGPYALVFQDGAGHELARAGFPVSFVLSEHGSLPDNHDLGLFSVQRPLPDGTRAVQIVRDLTALATYTLSANPPTVSVTAPAGGAFGAEDDVSVAWNASDPDGDPLTFNVFYSSDDGAAWQIIAAGVSEAALTWNTTLAAGSKPGSFSRLKVVASDGFHTAEAVSSRFTVAGKPPLVSITAPTSSARYVERQTIHLAGLATDLEDGLLPSGRLTWSSSLDGELGTGEEITPTLTVGTHKIVLRGVDSEGNTAEDTLVVTVESDFDNDGIPDRDEAANFWDPDDAGAAVDGVTNIDRSRGITHAPTGAPGIAAHPSVVALSAERGMVGQPDVLVVTSTDVMQTTWTATRTQPWLRLSAESGETPTTLEVTADASTLTPGTYYDTLLIQAGSFQQKVSVTLTVISGDGTAPPVSGAYSLYLPHVQRGDKPR